jgi:hypothetical protein
MSLSVLLERFSEVQSLGPEDQWSLIDELWSDLAQQVESEAPNENIVELLEKRFSDYLVDPSQGQPAYDAFARLAEHKRQWKQSFSEERKQTCWRHGCDTRSSCQGWVSTSRRKYGRRYSEPLSFLNRRLFTLENSDSQ